MRIDVVTLLNAPSETALRQRKDLISSYASSGTEIRIVIPQGLPPSIDSIAEMEFAAPGIMKSIVQSEQEGADAVIIWGGHDPSLLSARSLVDIPVLAPGSASMHIASLLADMFCLLVQVPEAEPIAVYSFGINAASLGDPEYYPQVKETVISSIDAGADAVCFGCMALNWHADRLIEEVSVERPGAIVIHPGKITIKLAELLVDGMLTQSRLSYPKPPN
jgi:allantoin racemase